MTECLGDCTVGIGEDNWYLEYEQWVEVAIAVAVAAPCFEFMIHDIIVVYVHDNLKLTYKSASRLRRFTPSPPFIRYTRISFRP